MFIDTLIVAILVLIAVIGVISIIMLASLVSHMKARLFVLSLKVNDLHEWHVGERKKDVLLMIGEENSRALNRYKESYKQTNDWLQKNAPDFVNDNIAAFAIASMKTLERHGEKIPREMSKDDGWREDE